MFKLADFPIGSKFRLYKIVNFQVDPYKRKKGTPKYKKGFAYCELTVTHHCKLSAKDEQGLIGSDWDNSNEGYCSDNSFLDKGVFVVPISAYQSFPLDTGDPMMDAIIQSTNTELAKPIYHRVFHKNSRKIAEKLYKQRSGQ